MLGAVLRGIDLGDGLWYDEIATLVRYVRRPFGEIVTRFDTQNQHTLYSIAAHMSVGVFGEHPWSLRLPAAVFGVACLWAVYWLGTRITTKREALVAAGLLSVSSHHVWFSQDARGYTMLMFFSVLGTGLMFELLERPTRRDAILYALVMALACWTQVAGAFVVVGHGVVWLMNRGRQPLLAMAGSGVLTVLLYSPVLGAMTRTLAGPKATGGAPEWKSLGWFVSQTVNGLARGVPGGWVGLLVGLAVVLTGLVSYWKSSRIATLLLVMPGVVTGGVMLITAHNLWPRLFFFALGFAALIAVRGGFEICRMLVRERGEMLATAGATVVGALSLLTMPRVWAPKQDYGAAMTWMASHQTPGAQVFTVDMTRLPYRDYYQAPFTPVDSASTLAAARANPAQAWILVTFPARLEAVDTAIWRQVTCCYQEVARFPGTVDGGAIVALRAK